MWKRESFLFYITVFITALPVLLFRFFPTMDGAAHLYNSNLIIELIAGNNTLGDYFRLNPEPVPNWLGHFILSIFNSFLPAFLAEKILLLMYIILLPLSFRKMLKAYGKPHLSYFIFPLVYTFLFYLGFYNLSIAFVLLFYTIAFWVKHDDKFTFRRIFILFVLISLSHFSHILIFSFLGLTLFLINIQQLISSGNKSNLRFYLKQYIALGIASLPALILFAGFFLKREFTSSTDALSTSELIQWLVDVRPVIALSYAAEGKLTQFIFYLLCLLTLTTIFYRIKSVFIRSENAKRISFKFLFRASDVFLFISLLILYLYFTTPNGSGAGMMSDRYALLFFIFFICWIATQHFHKWVLILSVAILIIVNTGLVWRYIKATADLSKEAVFINDAAEFIEPNSVVLPINRSPHWLQGHFSNYLGIDKPLVILENYEAHTGWFPVLWNDEDFPNLHFASQTMEESCLWWKSNTNNDPHIIDYVFIWGHNEPDDCQKEVNEVLKNYYEEINVPNDFVKLYKLRQ